MQSQIQEDKNIIKNKSILLEKLKEDINLEKTEVIFFKVNFNIKDKLKKI